ncbi:MAG: RsmD family RNA methyltransferase [Microbacteriaceae bacterium]|nr:RsmD family RNA methyltransferase [Microbacteriaceae bacterium]
MMRNAPKEGRTEVAVKAQSVSAFLESSTAEWDLVFLDPPYDITNEDLERSLAGLAPRLAPGAVIVLERASTAREPEWPLGVSLDRRRKYGDTTLWWAFAD